MAATAVSSASSALTKSSQAASSRPAVPLTRVAIRDSKTIAINDHVYISPPWAPGAGEPYLIARVMEFVTASSSRKGAQALASSSGTLQLRANVFLRQRDIHNKSLSDSRLLVATMHSDVFALENVRGLCVVKHRDLIGEAPEVAAWKKREDHFYYHQFYDRYLHRYYDVIPTERIRNVPVDVLAVLRNRYSFVVAEASMTPDLCGALRGCSICHRWASSAESVKCDTCKLFFHMDCLTPPLLSKPAKGYSWTCAPCSRANETVASGLPLSRTAALDASAAIASHSSNHDHHYNNLDNGLYTVNRVSDFNQRGNNGSRGGAMRGGRGRGRGKGTTQLVGRGGLLAPEDGISDQSRDSSPSPAIATLRRTLDDEKGTRCFNRWPYRYFGECTRATEILDPYDSIFPRAIPRLGYKFQAPLITWAEQEVLGLGVRSTKEIEFSDGTMSPMSEDPRPKKPQGRPPKKKKGEDTPTLTPTLSTIALPSSTVPASASVNISLENEIKNGNSGLNLHRLATDKEIERGTEDSVEALFIPGLVPDKKVDKYLKVCKQQLPDISNHVGMIDRALRLLMQYSGDAGRALHELTNSTNEQLMVDVWSLKESKQFDLTISEYNGDLRFLKKAVPTKTVAQIVRNFAYWKCKQLAKQREEEEASSNLATNLPEPTKSITTSGGVATMTTTSDAAAAVIGSGAAANRVVAEQATRAVSPSLSIMEGEEGNTSLTSVTQQQQQQLPSKICKLCTTASSSVWYKGPISWTNRRLCVNCGLYWRKYGAEMPSSHPDMVQSRKRDAAAMEESAGINLGVAPPIKAAKLARTESSMKANSPALVNNLPIPPIPLEPSKCVLCKRMEPKKKLQQCRQCSLSIHQGCYGLNDGELNNESWLCEACNNERTLDAALTPQCILCPRSSKSTAVTREEMAPIPQASTPSLQPSVARPRKSTNAAPAMMMQPATPLGALDVVKPTECNNWTHFHCALFMPEIVYTEPERMRMVEGSGNLPIWRYEAMCDLCNKREGACVGCADSSCKRTFHISCASQQSSFTLGIDLNPVKSTRRDTVVTTTFKGETGHMTAVIYCNVHKETAKSRKLIDLSDIDSSIGQTATQVFANTHKGVKTTTSHSEQNTYPLLRRAKRFDAVLSGNLSIFTKRAGSKQPLFQQHSIRLSSASIAPEDDTSINLDDSFEDDNKSLIIPRASKTVIKAIMSSQCARCTSPFSPFWWDLPFEAQEADEAEGSPEWLAKVQSLPHEKHLLCVRCRHLVLPRLIT